MVATKSVVDRNTRNHAHRQANQNARVQREAFRFVRCFLIEIGRDFTLEGIGVDLRAGWLFLIIFRHKFLSFELRVWRVRVLSSEFRPRRS